MGQKALSPCCQKLSRLWAGYRNLDGWRYSLWPGYFKAVALGAKSTLTGRAFLYGLGAAGQAGVTKALEIMHKELDMSMALCGHRDILNVDRNILQNCPF